MISAQTRPRRELHPTRTGDSLSVIVIGASGDLARRKIYPALFALYRHGRLPEPFRVMGFARTPMDDDAFRASIADTLPCRLAPGDECADAMGRFLARCHYSSGAYDSTDSFLDLHQNLRRHEPSPHADRLFYLAIPPSIFLAVARSVGDAGFVRCTEHGPWSRVVIEKPFGRDRRSSDELADAIGQIFSEPQIYRIDHYLGKEVIQNLIVLRFANVIFEPIWNRHHIRRIEIRASEDLGVEGRGGYYDESGIFRDVMQNHLAQILALVAMEPPELLDAHHIRQQKARALRHAPPLAPGDVVIGQYAAGQIGDRILPAYRDDPSVPPDSITPTYAAARVRIDNERWRGVPILMTAGKALAARSTEIRILFQEMPANLFCATGQCPLPNELRIRVQPDPGISLLVNTKRPGHDLQLASTTLDLHYESAFPTGMPEAYEALLLDVIEGDRSLFIHRDELEAAWDLFTPLLHHLEQERVAPVPYPAGSQGPDLSAFLARI